MVAGYRRRLIRQPFHESTVASDSDDLMVEEAYAFGVEGRLLPSLGHSHTDRCGNALAQRPAAGIDAYGDAIFRVASRRGPTLSIPA